MSRNRAPSPQTLKVITALASDPSCWRYGYELGTETGLKAGSLYPILVRLAERGLLEAQWEKSPPPGRPPRHLYRITANGLALAGEAAPAPGPRPESRARPRQSGRTARPAAPGIALRPQPGRPQPDGA